MATTNTPAKVWNDTLRVNRKTAFKEFARDVKDATAEYPNMTISDWFYTLVRLENSIMVLYFL